MLQVPTSPNPPGGTGPTPILDASDVAKPAGANNRLWPPTRTRIHVTFKEEDAEQVTATGEDPDSHEYVFTATLARLAQKELLAALATSVKSDFTNDTVVIPGKGDDGSGPKMKFSLKLGPAK
jgi:hypothetical protein